MSTSNKNTEHPEDAQQIAPSSAHDLLARAELAEMQLAEIVKLVEVGVLFLDKDGNVQLMNQSFEKLFGFDHGALADAKTLSDIGLRISNRIADPNAFLEHWHGRLNRITDATTDDLVLTNPAGVTLERFGHPVRSHLGGAPLGRLEVYRDISTTKELPNRLARTERLANLGQLTAGIAHELNNPLTSIIGYSQLLMRRRLDGQPAIEAQHIYHEAERASKIVKNLLLFAREGSSQKQLVDLNQIVERSLALRSYELGLQDIVITRELAPHLPPVKADAGQLQQVLLNLLINAEQAVAGTADPRIKLRTAVRGSNLLTLEISDTGFGIEPHILPQIFDPFFTTKASWAGTGLGLSIAQSIVQDHGGQISVKSEPGDGAQFTIELPAAEEDTAAGSDAKPPTEVARFAKPGRVLRVLVIEDEPTVARLAADVLTDDGHSVETVLDGRQGIVRALSNHQEVLICDLRMPHMDGRSIFKELDRQNSPLAKRTLFITGDTLAPATMEFLESTGMPYLAKPFRVEELKQAVARIAPKPSGSVVEMRTGPRDRRKGRRS